MNDKTISMTSKSVQILELGTYNNLKKKHVRYTFVTNP